MQSFRSHCVSSDEQGPMLTALDDLFAQAKADVLRLVDGQTTTRLEVSYRIDNSSLNESLFPPDEKQITQQKIGDAVIWLARQTSVREAQWLLKIMSQQVDLLHE